MLMIPPTLSNWFAKAPTGSWWSWQMTSHASAHAHVQPEPNIRFQFDHAWALLTWLGWSTRAEDIGRIHELPAGLSCSAA